MEQWKNAVACQIQQCLNLQQLEHLWNAILYDQTKHNSQYKKAVLPFLEKIWNSQAIKTLNADLLSFQCFGAFGELAH